MPPRSRASDVHPISALRGPEPPPSPPGAIGRPLRALCAAPPAVRIPVPGTPGACRWSSIVS